MPDPRPRPLPKSVAPSTAELKKEPARGFRYAPLGLGLAALPLVVNGACISGVLALKPPTLLLGVLACGAAFVGAAIGSRGLQRLQPAEKGRGVARAAFILGLLSPIVSAVLGFTFYLLAYTGRPLRRGGQARLPRPGTSEGWVAPLPVTLSAPPAVIHAWRVNAAAEAASVAAFAHLANELLAVGAPAALIEQAHVNALDEIRHARLCFGLAAAMDGSRVGLAPFPAATLPRDKKLDVVSLAAESVVESCVIESASARVAAILAARGELPGEIRAVLEPMAADEARHAAHGWEIVRWCLEVGGAAVEEAVRVALARMDAASTKALVEDDSLERWGIAGPTLWRQCVTDALADTRQKLSACGEVERTKAA
jgi:hypothetical protein